LLIKRFFVNIGGNYDTYSYRQTGCFEKENQDLMMKGSKVESKRALCAIE